MRQIFQDKRNEHIIRFVRLASDFPFGIFLQFLLRLGKAPLDSSSDSWSKNDIKTQWNSLASLAIAFSGSNILESSPSKTKSASKSKLIFHHCDRSFRKSFQ